MNRKTFYHLTLSLPYIALLMSGAFTYLVNGFGIFSGPGSAPDVLSGIVVFFTFSAALWAPLYTWMVVVMLLWGRDKKPHEIRTLYLLSPVLLACAMGIPALFMGLPDSGLFLLWGFLHMSNLDFVVSILFKRFSMEQSLGVGFIWAFMAALCIVIGYAFVGCALLIERVMQKRGFLLTDEPATAANEHMPAIREPASSANVDPESGNV